MSAVLAEALALAPMQPGDLDEVVAAEKMLFEFPWSRGNFRDSLVAGYSAWVCRGGASLVGYAVMMMVVDEAHVLNLSVHPAWQRRGYGRMLLEHLCAVARQMNASSMYLEVRPSNSAARALYRRSGFEVVGHRRGYYPARGGREDALVMTRLP